MTFNFILILCLIMAISSYCPAGSYIDNNGECRYCPPGYYSMFSDSEDCYICWPGTYSPYYGSEICLPCPDGSTSSAGASSCYIVNYMYNTY